MIDLHCHILPSLDDGPESLADSIAMARLAVDEGLKTIVVTPHYESLDRATPVADLARRVAEFQEDLFQEGIELELLPGCELYLTPEIPSLFESGNLIPLANGPYILVETAFHEYPAYADGLLFELQARGLRPILAHPERYTPFQQQPERLLRLSERGILAQITAGSLLGHFGRRATAAAEFFLQNGTAHLISTDAHRAMGKRTTAIREAVRRAGELVGESRAHAMIASLPAAIVAGSEIVLPPVNIASSNGGWGFFRRLVGARS